MSSAVQLLKERIQAEGKNLGNGILKIDSILNHQLDIPLMMACGEEIAQRFADKNVTRILTAEVSGIAPAMAAGHAMRIPVVYARKIKPVTIFGPVFLETAPSHTKGMEVNLIVSAEFLPAGERVLIIDDFLASGKTLRSLVRIVRSAECELVGIACIVEKIFEEGRTMLSKYNVPIETLVKVISMDDGQIILEDG
ncbi:MAG: xanthine phosphoribosyltransferase [Chloroflexi bacterium]|nr:xanthine phosphoribosyltransferase [Chloroflexota bacterium]